MITSISDKFIINKIINTLRPSGFFIKTEINFTSIQKDLSAIMEGKMVYSYSINKFLNNKLYQKTNNFNEKDLIIIHSLLNRKSLSYIAKKINLTISGVEYRKRRIAEKLGAKTSNIDEILVLDKKELGL